MKLNTIPPDSTICATLFFSLGFLALFIEFRRVLVFFTGRDHQNRIPRDLFGLGHWVLNESLTVCGGKRALPEGGQNGPKLPASGPLLGSICAAEGTRGAPLDHPWVHRERLSGFTPPPQPRFIVRTPPGSACACTPGSVRQSIDRCEGGAPRPY